MASTVVQFTFGSFGDIVTLIQTALFLKNLVVGHIRFRNELKELVEFLDNYLSILLVIQSVLQSPQARILPLAARNAMEYSLRASIKSLNGFQSQLEETTASDRSSGLQQLVMRTLWWSLRSEADFKELQERLCDHGNIITQMLALCGLKMSLDTASALRSIPAQPEAFSVTLTDFLGEVRTIPIEFCLNAEAFDRFARLFFNNRADSSFVTRGDYEVVLENDDRFVVPWGSGIQPGSKVDMNATLRKLDGECHNCPSCGYRHPSKGKEQDSYAKCPHCQTIYRVTNGEVFEVVESTDEIVEESGSSGAEDAPLNETSPDIDDCRFIRRYALIPVSAETIAGPIDVDDDLDNPKTTSKSASNTSQLEDRPEGAKSPSPNAPNTTEYESTTPRFRNSFANSFPIQQRQTSMTQVILIAACLG